MTSGNRGAEKQDKHGDRSTDGDGRATQMAISRAQAGDVQAIHYLYVRYHDDVLGYVKSVVKDHHEAEDITQNVFLKLTTAIRKYEPRGVPFAAWILRVARNAALDHIRSRRALPCEEVRVHDYDRRRISHERRKDLRKALDQLPGEQREVLILRHIVGLSPVEIANALGKTESSIHGLHHRGRQTLQAALEDLGAAPVVARSLAG
ncbi:MAG TPA: sigma-70 family RNA polymerase sigma factor [Solirubrobacterales bacterium]|nr:sigma-70 family RNA polymerase sigma factor [Solirubrobacterales bacterium]